MAHPSVEPRAPLDQRPAGAWYREVTREQWMAFIGSYLGWTLDGFDYTILTFLLADVQRSFEVNAALAGALGQVTLMFRVAGGVDALSPFVRGSASGALTCRGLRGQTSRLRHERPNRGEPNSPCGLKRHECDGGPKEIRGIPGQDAAERSSDSHRRADHALRQVETAGSARQIG